MFPPEARVDERHPEEPSDAGEREPGLADDVVVWIALDVVLGDPGDDPEAVRDDPADREQQRPVEVPQVGAFSCARPRSRRYSLGCRVVDHQSVRSVDTSTAFLWKNSSNTWRAEGAAASPPKPPFSITAHTTSLGESYGPNPHHQDVSVGTA